MSKVRPVNRARPVSGARFAGMGLLAGSLVSAQALAYPQGSDPHSPAIEALARDALPRARIRQISARIRPITGLSSATSGRVETIRNLVTDLRAAGLSVASTDAGLRVTIPDKVLFDFDRATLRAGVDKQLRAIGAAALAVPDLPVRVEGHTDAKGTAAYNETLSDRRAEAVRSWLERAGVAAARLSAQGLGAGRPVAPNARPDGTDDPAGRQRNRRVEIVIGA